MLRVVLFILVGFFGVAEAPKIFAETNCVSGDCENGIGRSISKRGFMYFGEWQNGKWNGYGFIADSNGKCEGRYVNSSAQGISNCSYKNGKRFFGYYSRGRRSGEGIFFNLTGSIDREGIFSRKGGVERSIIDLGRVREDLRSLRDSAPTQIKNELPRELLDYGPLDLLITGRSQQGNTGDDDSTEIASIYDSLPKDIMWAIDSCVDTGNYIYTEDEDARASTIACLKKYRAIFPY